MMLKKKKKKNKVVEEDKEICMRWTGKGWTAQVIENIDGGGWAVSMTRDGNDLPTLVVPWVMGRNKKDPKPLNKMDFVSQVKAAQDFLTRSQIQNRSPYRVRHDVISEQGDWVRVVFDVIPNEFEPEGELVGLTRNKEELARASCPATFKLTRELAEQWVNSGFEPIEHESW